MSRVKAAQQPVRVDEESQALLRGLRENGLLPDSWFGPREEREPEEEIEP